MKTQPTLAVQEVTRFQIAYPVQMNRVEPAVASPLESAFEPCDLLPSRFDSWIGERMQINVEKRLLKLDLDMLLEPFENRPGKQWWAGEHVGKYLHAATYAWQFTGDERLRARLDHTAERLIATQQSNGYLGTYEEKDQFAWGDGLGWNAPVWDVWTHKYVLIGLLTYYQATGVTAALEASKRAADLMHELFVVKKRSLRLASAHVGMAATSVLEPIAALYRLTGERRYLEFCHRIVDSWEDESNPETWMYEDGCRLLSSLLEHGNVYRTANRKAYEMLSNLVGLMDLYRVDPDERFLAACINAWNDIASKRLYLTGTASYFEQFTQDGRLPPGQAVGEGCVTVTWLQLTSRLFELTGEVQYADELERTMYNALLGAQSPVTGEVTYFVPLNGKKHYNGHDVKLDPAISCCSSSVPRGIALIPTFASGTLHGNPALLQYIPGRHVLSYAHADGKGDVTLTVGGNYPSSGDFDIVVELNEAARFSIVLRVPSWAARFEASVGGSMYSFKDSRLIEIERDWTPGDRIHVSIPLEIRAEQHPDETLESSAFVRGPQVLATDAAVDAAGGIPASGWWGNVMYEQTVKTDGEEMQYRLVTFADAGQTKDDYAVLHDRIDSD